MPLFVPCTPGGELAKRISNVEKLNHHGGADVKFIMKVTGVHDDSLDRQVTEGVNIANFRGDVLMNRRGSWEE